MKKVLILFSVFLATVASKPWHNNVVKSIKELNEKDQWECEAELNQYRECMKPLQKKYAGISGNMNFWRDLDGMLELSEDVNNINCNTALFCYNVLFESHVYESLKKMINEIYEESSGCVASFAKNDVVLHGCSASDILRFKHVSSESHKLLQLIDHPREYINKLHTRRLQEKMDVGSREYGGRIEKNVIVIDKDHVRHSFYKPSYDGYDWRQTKQATAKPREPDDVPPFEKPDDSDTTSIERNRQKVIDDLYPIYTGTDTVKTTNRGDPYAGAEDIVTEKVGQPEKQGDTKPLSNPLPENTTDEPTESTAKTDENTLSTASDPEIVTEKTTTEEDPFAMGMEDPEEVGQPEKDEETNPLVKLLPGEITEEHVESTDETEENTQATVTDPEIVTEKTTTDEDPFAEGEDTVKDEFGQPEKDEETNPLSELLPEEITEEPVESTDETEENTLSTVSGPEVVPEKTTTDEDPFAEGEDTVTEEVGQPEKDGETNPLLELLPEEITEEPVESTDETEENTLATVPDPEIVTEKTTTDEDPFAEWEDTVTEEVGQPENVENTNEPEAIFEETTEIPIEAEKDPSRTFHRLLGEIADDSLESTHETEDSEPNIYLARPVHEEDSEKISVALRIKAMETLMAKLRETAKTTVSPAPGNEIEQEPENLEKGSASTTLDPLSVEIKDESATNPDGVQETTVSVVSENEIIQGTEDLEEGSASTLDPLLEELTDEPNVDSDDMKETPVPPASENELNQVPEDLEEGSANTLDPLIEKIIDEPTTNLDVFEEGTSPEENLEEESKNTTTPEVKTVAVASNATQEERKEHKEAVPEAAQKPIAGGTIRFELFGNSYQLVPVMMSVIISVLSVLIMF